MNVKKYTVFLAVSLMMLRVQALFAGPDIRENILLPGAPSGQYESQKNGWTTPEKGQRKDILVPEEFKEYEGSDTPKNCIRVQSTTDTLYFIPTKTRAEWDEFKKHLPEGITLAYCPIDGKCGTPQQKSCKAGDWEEKDTPACGGQITWTCKGRYDGKDSPTCQAANIPCPTCNTSGGTCVVGKPENASLPQVCGRTQSWTCVGGHKGDQRQSCTAPTASCCWKVGSWSACNSSCSSRRDVWCYNPFGGSSGCSGYPPSQWASCNDYRTEACKDVVDTRDFYTDPKCPTTGRWEYQGEWSACDKSCGSGGRQYRKAVCMKGGSVVDASQCEGNAPLDSRPCEVTIPCPKCGEPVAPPPGAPPTGHLWCEHGSREVVDQTETSVTWNCRGGLYNTDVKSCTGEMDSGSENSDEDITGGPFITTYNVGANRSLFVRVSAQGKIKIDWGDGKVEIVMGGHHSHTYAQGGKKTVQITGKLTSFKAHPSIVSVDDWGGMSWTTMQGMFEGATQLTSLASDPDLSRVESMSYMLKGATSFNQSIESWDVSNVKNMKELFRNAYAFNQPLNSWDVSNVTNMEGMFYDARAFNQSIESWDVSNVKNMSYMMANMHTFNQPLGNWNVSNVTDMSHMFHQRWTHTAFNQPLGNWNVAKVENMSYMFCGARVFNQPLDSWNVSNVTDMQEMFQGAYAFNQPLNSWNVSNVTNMREMFKAAPINQCLNKWNVSNVTNMSSMFSHASHFSGDLSGWCVSQIASAPPYFDTLSGLQGTPHKLPKWGTCPDPVHTCQVNPTPSPVLTPCEMCRNNPMHIHCQNWGGQGVSWTEVCGQP